MSEISKSIVPLLAMIGLSCVMLIIAAFVYEGLNRKNTFDLDTRLERLTPFWRNFVIIVVPVCGGIISLILFFIGAKGIMTSIIQAAFSAVYLLIYIFCGHYSNYSMRWISPFILAMLMLDGTFYFINHPSVRFNLTDSQPKGIYTLQPSEEAAHRGDLVTFCLESNNPFTALAKERGYVGGGTCPSGLKPLLKRLAGLPGDELEIAPDGLILNGNFLHLSFRPPCDSRGREMPPSLLQNGKIPEGQALVLSQEHGNSFDSRHFGLVPLDSLTRVEPVLTFETESK